MFNNYLFSEIETIVKEINQLVRDYSEFMTKLQNSNIRQGTSEFETVKCRIYYFTNHIMEKKSEYDKAKNKLSDEFSLMIRPIEVWDGTQTNYSGWEDRYDILFASIKKVLSLIQYA
jgi:protein subunit release factor A